MFALPDIGRTLWSEALEAVFHAWLQGLLCVREVEEAGMQMPALLRRAAGKALQPCKVVRHRICRLLQRRHTHVVQD